MPLRPAEVVRKGAVSEIGSKRTYWVSCSDAADKDDSVPKEDVELTVDWDIVLRMPPTHAGLVGDPAKLTGCMKWVSRQRSLQKALSFNM